MEELVYKRIQAVESIVKIDSDYQNMLTELRTMEKRYFAVLGTLPTEQQEIICDFVSQCEEMSWRMLELACIHMRFPNE